MGDRVSVERNQRAFHIEAAWGRPWNRKELMFEKPVKSSVAGASAWEEAGGLGGARLLGGGSPGLCYGFDHLSYDSLILGLLFYVYPVTFQ